MAVAENTPQAEYKPYVPDEANLAEFTWSAVLVGAILGIIFGASSLYLVLNVGMTVSASVPIAVLSITLFRVFSRLTGFRQTTILENNIVQTTGSAGESIAFGVGVTMPALLLLGFEMDVVRVMTVAVLGGLLGILMMIPLRRAFIVKQHGTLKYPEGTACAEVLIAGEKGGATARMVFIGFGIAVVYKFLSAACKIWPSDPSESLSYVDPKDNKIHGLKGAEVGGELTPELLGVGYLIGPRIASLMLGGAFLSYFVLGPMIAAFGEQLRVPVLSDTKKLIKDMSPGEIQKTYLRYIGAGAVAAGGIISMIHALPLIFSSIISGLRDLRATRAGAQQAAKRTERDMPMSVVLFGSIGMVAALMFVPSLGLGVTVKGFLGALMILVFGFLFVTVSSRLTGEIGSSSNPISGMTIATLLLTCIIFYLANMREEAEWLTALMVAAVVCIASSNGGTTSQDLKTGFLVGATPQPQQWSILIGALTSALVIGVTMLLLDAAGTHYTNKGLPKVALPIEADAPLVQVGVPHAEEDKKWYHVVHVRNDLQDEFKKEHIDVKLGRYLVDDEGKPRYWTDTPIARENKTMDNGRKAPKEFSAPQPRLFYSIITGILGGKLQWSLFIIGVLIALAMELAGIRALPFAVGMYLPIAATLPIFAGGLLRGAVDKLRGPAASEAEAETSPAVLLSSGYIAGGTLCGLVIAFFFFLPEGFNRTLDLSRVIGISWAEQDDETSAKITVAEYKAREEQATAETEEKKAEIEETRDSTIDNIRSAAWLESPTAKIVSLIAFGILAAILLWQGLQKTPADILNTSQPLPPAH